MMLKPLPTPALRVGRFSVARRAFAAMPPSLIRCHTVSGDWPMRPDAPATPAILPKDKNGSLSDEVGRRRRRARRARRRVPFDARCRATTPCFMFSFIAQRASHRGFPEPSGARRPIRRAAVRAALASRSALISSSSVRRWHTPPPAPRLWCWRRLAPGLELGRVHADPHRRARGACAESNDGCSGLGERLAWPSMGAISCLKSRRLSSPSLMKSTTVGCISASCARCRSSCAENLALSSASVRVFSSSKGLQRLHIVLRVGLFPRGEGTSPRQCRPCCGAMWTLLDEGRGEVISLAAHNGLAVWQRLRRGARIGLVRSRSSRRGAAPRKATARRSARGCDCPASPVITLVPSESPRVWPLRTSRSVCGSVTTPLTRSSPRGPSHVGDVPDALAVVVFVQQPRPARQTEVGVAISPALMSAGIVPPAVAARRCATP